MANTYVDNRIEEPNADMCSVNTRRTILLTDNDMIIGSNGTDRTNRTNRTSHFEPFRNLEYSL